LPPRPARRIIFHSFNRRLVEIDMLIQIAGRALFAEIEPTGRFDCWQASGEYFLRVGKLAVIYTPANWRARRDRAAVTPAIALG
jgi:hypothetical protein